jgi:ABC-2 type transport system ATP-binding protein
VVEPAQLDEATRIVAEVTEAEPNADAALRTVIAPTSGGVAALLAVAERLARAGVAIDDLSLRQPTLDEVFLTLTGAVPDDPSTTDTEEVTP